MKKIYTNPQLTYQVFVMTDVLIASYLGDNDTSWDSDWNGGIGGGI